jgi:hypothetical protein
VQVDRETTKEISRKKGRQANEEKGNWKSMQIDKRAR